jgi:hypothetical protein
VIAWFLFFCVNVGLVLYLYLGNHIQKDNFDSAISQLNASYVTYLGVIVTFYLTAGRRSGSRRGERIAFAIAMMGSLIWNGIILIFIGRLALGSGTIEDSVEQIGSISSKLSWLVAPAIGFYFAQTSLSETRNKPEKKPDQKE